MVIRYPLHCTTCPCSTVTASLDVSKTCKQDTDSPMMRNLTALSRYSHACIHSLLLLQVVLVIDSTARVVRSKNLKSRFWHAITVSKRDCQRGLWVFVSSKNAVHLWVHLYTRCSVPILDAVSPRSANCSLALVMSGGSERCFMKKTSLYHTAIFYCKSQETDISVLDLLILLYSPLRYYGRETPLQNESGNRIQLMSGFQCSCVRCEEAVSRIVGVDCKSVIRSRTICEVRTRLPGVVVLSWASSHWQWSGWEFTIWDPLLIRSWWQLKTKMGRLSILCQSRRTLPISLAFCSFSSAQRGQWSICFQTR